MLKSFGKLTELEKFMAEQRAEIDRLKGLKGPPVVKPSGMDNGTEPAKPDQQQNSGSASKIRPRVAFPD